MPECQIYLSHKLVQKSGALAEALKFEDLRLVLVLKKEVEARYDHVAVSEVCRHVVLLLWRSGT